MGVNSRGLLGAGCMCQPVSSASGEKQRERDEWLIEMLRITMLSLIHSCQRTSPASKYKPMDWE